MAYNMDALSQVRFGDPDGLNEFLFENGIQHQSFAERLQDSGFQVPRYPLIDADVEDLDDWLAIHQIEHQSVCPQSLISTIRLTFLIATGTKKMTFMTGYSNICLSMSRLLDV
jgi:hypothetical protein